MPSSILEDIAPEPASAEVSVDNGKPLKVYAISNLDLCRLMVRFPHLQGGVTAVLERPEGRTPEQAEEIAKAVNAVIACAVGEPGNERTELLADKFALQDKLKIVARALELTLPDGQEGDGPLANGSASSAPAQETRQLSSPSPSMS